MHWRIGSIPSIPGVLILFILPLLAPLQYASAARKICISARGIKICAEMRGSCDLSQLLPREKTRLEMDLFEVSIINGSRRHLSIIPENFYGVTVQGHVIALDPPFYQSIELKTKLKRRELPPGEQMRGLLFFPRSAAGSVRTIIHGGEPYLEIMMY